MSGKTMKAAVLYEQNRPLVIEEITIPQLQTGQVLVKIFASGLCHSQLNEIKGHKGPDKFLPHTLGHEGSGVVEAVGSEVKKVKTGDHVVLSWIKGSGLNAAPPDYFSGSRKINSGQLSTFNEYAVTAENRVTPIRPDMPLDKAALLGCAVATGMGVIFNNARVKAGDTVAVFGTGGIGLSAVHAAAIAGAAKIFAVDINEAKLALAGEMGATHLIDARQADAVKMIMDVTGTGVDFAVESAGLKKTMEDAFRAVRNNGGRAILIGNLAHGQQISIDPFTLICGKQIVGSWGGETDPDRDIPRYVDLYLNGQLKLDKMISQVYALSEINQAFADLEEGKVARAMVEMMSDEGRI